MYSSFAVVGVGYVGLLIIKALVQQQASVLVLTCSPPKSDLPEGVTTVRLRSTDIASIARALQQYHIEVVISTVDADELRFQNSVAEISKGAGVKLFLPSDFGMPSEGSTPQDSFAAKDKSAKYIQSLGIPTSRIYASPSTSNKNWSRSNGKVNLLENIQGETPISFTSVVDAAGFVAYILTKLDPARLVYTSFRIEGQRTSIVDIALTLGMSVERVSEVPSHEFPLAGSFQEYFETGRGTINWDSAEDKEEREKPGNSNSLWDNHRWKTISEVLHK
ncbi:hypothetical protein H2248_006058 [Termitomyces sp. 'cryptogamus']|nr:hypothetical protein H2248_006058 [Termitomyces sp. 'cryptogamus']